MELITKEDLFLILIISVPVLLTLYADYRSKKDWKKTAEIWKLGMKKEDNLN